MRHLPDEIILQIIAYLQPSELVLLQHVSRQFLRLSRDNNLWRTLCFEHSAPERRRRRLHPNEQDATDPRLAALIQAANDVASAFPAAQHDPRNPTGEGKAQSERRKRREALRANWDPAFPGEKVDWYAEFVARHAPHEISWFQEVTYGRGIDDGVRCEATGAGVLYGGEGLAEKLVAPLEDGSICVWDASARSGERGLGRIVARSKMGLLPGKGSDLDLDTRFAQSRAVMTETGAVECVSVDSRAEKGFFAVGNALNEVDLRTLQVVSRTPYPFPVTALSEARHPTPLTVGTNWTVHLHDTRKPAPSSVRCELIGGSPTSFSRLETGDFGGHVSLAQPGALSILHLPTTREWDANGDIWLAGRFTSFLNFDRRFFPRLRGTVHSGARLSCLTAIPHPFIPNELRSYHNTALLNEAKSLPGHTLVAAGEYKGKGSLELYSLSSAPGRGITSSDARTTQNHLACYQNRQTASASKLLSVARHGTRIVFSDGDGGLKWVERDGSTPVRQVNINEGVVREGEQGELVPRAEGDFVQKILTSVEPSLDPITSNTAVPLGTDNLILWTGDGRLGLVGFGHASPGFGHGEAGLDGLVESEERARERVYGREMRKALEMQAREARWLRGYGL